MAKKLTKKDIATKLKKLGDWDINKPGTLIFKTYKTDNYLAGLMFIARITVKAEVANHHPDVELSYHSVKVKLTSHTDKSLCKKDFDLANDIDVMYEKMVEKAK